MKRLLAACLAAGFLLLPAPASGAEDAPEVWDGDRLVKGEQSHASAVRVAANLTVQLELYLNSSEGLSASTLEFRAGVEVCGTAEAPVTFTGSEDSIQAQEVCSVGCEGGYGSRRSSFRNATFEDIYVVINDSRCEFQDCTFVSTEVYILESPCLFENCSFRAASVSVSNSDLSRLARLTNCTFDGNASFRGPAWPAGLDRFGRRYGAFVAGYAELYRCRLAGYSLGLVAFSGVPNATDCSFSDCDTGLAFSNEDPTDVPTVRNCTVERCRDEGLFCEASALIVDSSFSGSKYGLSLENDKYPHTSYDWTVRGNRITGNSLYGVHLLWQDCDLSANTFDGEGGAANGLGRVLKRFELLVTVTAPGGRTLDRFNLTWSDATGASASLARNSAPFWGSTFTEYTLDNAGARTDHLPLTVRVEARGRSNSTVLETPTSSLSFEIPVLADLLPRSVHLDPESPRAGRFLNFWVVAENFGAEASGRARVRFTVDDETLDESDLFDIPAGGNLTVRSLDWKATEGRHVLRVSLDTGNVVFENNESNNELSHEFTVGPAPPREREPPAPWPHLALGAAALAVVLGAALIAIRRRRKGRA